MWQDFRKHISDWVVEYSPFTDVLEVRDNRVLQLPDDELVSETYGAAQVYYEAATKEPVMVILPQAYEYIGSLDEDTPSEELLNRLVGYLQANHGA